MKIAYLILAHTDPEHIKKLSKKLTEHESGNKVFIHLDKKIDDKEFFAEFNTKDFDNIIFCQERVSVFWGGYSAIKATYSLIDESLNYNDTKFDRFVILQGLDYPIKSNQYINDFFEKNKKYEFINSCNISKSEDKYFYSKAKYVQYFDNLNFIKKVFNKIIRILDIKINRKLKINDEAVDLYWGSAQWALTYDAIKYIHGFKDNTEFNHIFKSIFPADEIYFQTIIQNSKFKQNIYENCEYEYKKGLVNYRNLHYFEYKDAIKIFNENDFDYLMIKEELYARKINTLHSKKLVSLIDKIHNEE